MKRDSGTGGRGGRGGRSGRGGGRSGDHGSSSRKKMVKEEDAPASPAQVPPTPPPTTATAPTGGGGGGGGSGGGGDDEENIDEDDGARQTLVPSGQIIHQGYLEKRGGGTTLFGRKNWKKRWFVLYFNVIKYYPTEQIARTKPQDSLGEITLKSDKPIKIESRSTGGKEVPHIDIPSQDGRMYEVRTSDQAVADVWKEKISAAVSRLARTK
jgi:hypothetical protein